MRLLIAALVALTLTACNESGGGETAIAKNPENLLPSDPEQPADPSNPVQDPAPVTPETVQLTFYAMSRTEAPINGWPTKTFTATGYCAVYEAATYCWDDGIKTIDFTSGGFRYFAQNTFWSVSATDHCRNSCATDGMISPVKVIANQFPKNQIDQHSVKKVEDVLAMGTPATTSCTKSGTTMTCGNLTFNLN